MLMRGLAVILFLLAVPSWAQIVLAPVPRGGDGSKRARTTENEVHLPFWDDFSFTATNQPVDTLWLNGTTVWVNHGLAINPPSLKVGTFDGLDAEGKPYNVNNVLAKGYADVLESQPIRMDAVGASERSTVFISFYYQMKGRGETPDQGDLFLLQFKDANEKWETVWSVENDGTLQPEEFVSVILPVTDEKYFHEKFQFRFQNFARLSGPYDTWHVDYIYLDKGRSATDTIYPDRALVNSIGPLFSSFWAVPLKHFKQLPELNKPTFEVENHCNEAPQPISFLSWAHIKTYANDSESTETLLLEDATDNALAVPALQKTTYEMNRLPSLGELDLEADSLQIDLEILVDSDDETNVANPVCNPSRYPTIDFSSNDSTRARYTLSSFYAYDDGTAEYGAGLNQPGAELAYEFNLVGVTFDSLAALDFYFPRFGDETSQVIELRVWSALSDNPEDVIYKETVTIERSQQNVFWRKRLPESKRVPSRFFIGWKQNSAAVIAIGLDKNSDSGNKMYYNTIGTWEQNTQLAGNFMMRPVFGKGRKGEETGLSEKSAFRAYPNPTKGTFYFEGHSDRTVVLDAVGRPVAFDEQRLTDSTQITLANALPGIYFLKVESEGIVRATKMLIVP